MKIVIDIPDGLYHKMTKTYNELTWEECMLILDNIEKKSTPLPKGHGTLKDTDAICKDIISALGIRDENYLLEAEKAIYKRIKNATAIIEADKEVKNEKH